LLVLQLQIKIALEGAAVQGGVVGVLSNSNPNDPSGHYTVFAPTNDAFAK
jgi:uncharacterized surface protein with fasciclin (FAS1) repeats